MCNNSVIVFYKLLLWLYIYIDVLLGRLELDWYGEYVVRKEE